ncbi:MAG: helix-turn-helix domain-containing protein [Oscillospiraceae bacterium]|nr:helix-turn-helix domain-containing protein [Oscillospiraceae bacterium]
MALRMNNLKLYRKKSGYTQEQIAEKLGVSRQAVAKWENGDSLPDIENVIALADLYEVTVDYLVRNMSEPVKPSDDKDKHIFGITKLNDKGQITLPKNCREVFGLQAGDAILVLGDEKKGIALVKMGEIFGK